MLLRVNIHAFSATHLCFHLFAPPSRSGVMSAPHTPTDDHQNVPETSSNAQNAKLKKFRRHTLDAYERFMLDLVVGGAAASTAKTTWAPVERTKLLLQVQHSQPRIKQHYAGIIDCLRRVPREQGVSAYWRGNYVNLVRYFPTFGLNFAFKEKFRHLFGADKVRRQDKMQYFLCNMAAGGTAGLLSSFFVYPLDFAATRLMADVGRSSLGTREFNGAHDVAYKIGVREGIRGFYRGFFVSAQGIVIYRAAYFGLYDSMKAELADKPENLNFLIAWALGIGVSVTAELLAYPWDTIRRRLMLQSGRRAHRVQYSGALNALVTIVKHEGPLALYKGSMANVIRAIGSGRVLATYDEFIKYYEFVRTTHNNLATFGTIDPDA